MTDISLPIYQRVFRREFSSLAQYLGGSCPWSQRSENEANKLFRSIMEDEQTWLAELVELIDRRGGVPKPDNYPTEFTDQHFLALDYLLARLADYIRGSIKDLDQDQRQLIDDPPAKDLIDRMIAQKREQVLSIEKLLG